MIALKKLVGIILWFLLIVLFFYLIPHAGY